MTITFNLCYKSRHSKYVLVATTYFMRPSVTSGGNIVYSPTIFVECFQIYKLTFRNYMTFLMFCVLAHISSVLKYQMCFFQKKKLRTSVLSWGSRGVCGSIWIDYWFIPKLKPNHTGKKSSVWLLTIWFDFSCFFSLKVINLSRRHKLLVHEKFTEKLTEKLLFVQLSDYIILKLSLHEWSDSIKTKLMNFDGLGMMVVIDGR